MPNSLPKDLKSKRSVASFAHEPWFTIKLFLKTSPCEGLHSSKLNSANWIIRKYRKLHIRICFARFSQIQLQQLFTGKESIVLKSPPTVVVLSYFTASENEDLRTERKQNYEIKNEKRKKTSDSYYLSNRKVIEVICSSRISLLQPFAKVLETLYRILA